MKKIRNEKNSVFSRLPHAFARALPTPLSFASEIPFSAKCNDIARKVWIYGPKFSLLPLPFYHRSAIILPGPGGFMSLAIVYTRAAL
ncbi:hypothetical protein NL360_27775, partial [Klebsiella pneumoniae]|nr:hypothetical protein [Klebsiella pneumoniae]